MKHEEIALFYQYNAWANARILNAAANVSREQFPAPASFPHGGLRGTLTHIVSAERTWRMRWLGESPARSLNPEDFPSLDSLQARWLDEERELTRFLETVSEEALNGSFEYKDTKGNSHRNVLWQTMVHLVNHGTQHRSEAAAMLTDLGHSPGDMDLILYLRRQG